MHHRLPVLGLGLATLAGCAEKLTVPRCEQVSFSQASVSGDMVTTTGLRYIDGARGSGVVSVTCATMRVAGAAMATLRGRCV